MSKLKAAVMSNKGQKSLFSFFKKPAAAPAVAVVQDASPPLPIPQPQGETVDALKTTSPLPVLTPGTDGRALVDKRIEVFWPKDNVWYKGTVGEFDISDGSHTIAYDDGIVEVLNLDEEEYRLEDAGTAKRKLIIDDEEDVQPNKRRTIQKKVTRRIVDDEDEGEWSGAEESKGSATDGASWMSSSSDEFSADEEEDDEPARKSNKSTKAAAKPPARPPRANTSAAPPKTPSTASKIGRSTFNSTGNTSTASFTPNQSQSTMSIFSPIGAFHGASGEETAKKDDSPPFILPEGVTALGSHDHDSWPFYVKCKDNNGVARGETAYNPRTWQVPSAFLKSQTPAMKQWFEFKCENFDVVLFFKVGKFYELFHMDADIGFKELDLIFMKGTKGHSGFPEVSYGKYASMLVAKGYRVARVEQTETPDMLKERNKSAGKGAASKVVARELCSIMSKGTRTFCHLDDVSLTAADSQESISGPSSLLLCIKESAIERPADAMDVVAVDSDDTAVVEYGICYVDTVLGLVTLSQFQDDFQRSRLRTMLSSMPPSEVLVEKRQDKASDALQCSPETVGAIRLANPKVIFEYLSSGTEFPVDSATVLKTLKTEEYFKSVAKGDGDETAVYPTVLKAVVRGLGDSSSLLVTLAMGGALWCLKRALIDHEVFSLGKIHAYIPPDNHMSRGTLLTNAEGNDCDDFATSDGPADQPQHMVLDAVALANLEILQNNFDKTEKGSLWSFVNKCKTPFGRRLLKSWLVKPLYRVEDIRARGAAVEELMTGLAGSAELARKVLKSVPDVERLLARVHTNGSKERAVNHPDGRAQMYEGTIYNGRKIRDFVDLINGLESLLQLEDIFGDSTVESPSLRKVLKGTSAGGQFPYVEMREILQHFRRIFDEKQAKRDGTIKPRPGLNDEYDAAMAVVKSIERELDDYLREQKKITGISDISYWGTGKDRYQIEVPMGQASKVPSKWTTKSQKKTHRRYRTAFIESKFIELTEAEDKVSVAEKDTMRSIFEKFDMERRVWSRAVLATAVLDGLLSLAIVSSAPGYVWPEFSSRQSSEKQQPFLQVTAGRHAMLEHSLVEKGAGDYIPNDLNLGGSQSAALFSQSSQSDVLPDGALSPNMLLLSGPNMGGKSTLLRQTCLLCVLAQMGCRVPAAKFSLTPVDRIFTRVGASDRILSGQSTFFVELAETALILKAATIDSLCILDELGRGTSTFDGTAIAHSVVDHLVGKVRCRSLFATHYHSLADDWAVDPRVKLGHMDCLVQGESATDQVDGDDSEKVTFLYHLCDGSSPKSYGVNVARLAGLPAEVLALAVQQSNAFLSKKEIDNSGLEKKNTIALRQRYFDTLVSLVSSSMSTSELLTVTTELWRRCIHDLASM